MESDLSVFHRVDDMSSMGSRRWARLVPRLFAYAGAVQLRARAMSAESESAATVQPVVQAGGGGVGVSAPDGTPLLAGPASPMTGGKVVEATATALQFSDIGDMFSFG